MQAPALELWFPEIVLVVEGAARSAAAAHAAGPHDRDGSGSADRRLRVIAAPGSGDDTIAAVAGELGSRRLGVTAAREPRARCPAARASGARPVRPLGPLL